MGLYVPSGVECRPLSSVHTPGFTAFETAFAAVFSEMVRPASNAKPVIDLKYLSSLMSARPARLLGFGGPYKRGRIISGYRADLVIVDTNTRWIVNSQLFATKGKNSPFEGQELCGKILMTFHEGRVVYQKVPSGRF